MKWEARNHGNIVERKKIFSGRPMEILRCRTSATILASKNMVY